MRIMGANTLPVRPSERSHRMITASSVVGPLLHASAVASQTFDEITSTPMPPGEGWDGFTDFGFGLNALLTLCLAAVLGAVIAYHPMRVRTADTLEELEAPKACIMYAVIGSMIGIMVVKYGLGVGFVLFGIGGLIRFRTVMRSAHLTGQVILVTLIGLSCGLDLPHVAVLATAFTFLLMFLLGARVTYQVDVRGLPRDRFKEATEAYRHVLESDDCRILGERKRPSGGRVRFIFRGGPGNARTRLEQRLETDVPAELRGSLDWEID